ncbi:MAG: hypothetical protein KA964_06285 [Comamonas sp.]|nr:hypothetical protein [Comamonas sp.]
MLEQIRRNRRLGTTVLLLCIALWLVALWAGVRVRAVSGPAPVVAAMAPASAVQSHAAAHVHGTHAAHDSPHAAIPDGGLRPSLPLNTAVTVRMARIACCVSPSAHRPRWPRSSTVRPRRARDWGGTPRHGRRFRAWPLRPCRHAVRRHLSTPECGMPVRMP